MHSAVMPSEECERDASSSLARKEHGPLRALRCGGTCPHCVQRARFTRIQVMIENVAKAARLRESMSGYHCDTYMKSILVWYGVIHWDPTRVDKLRFASECVSRWLPVLDPYDFEHVPGEVAREVRRCSLIGLVEERQAFARAVWLPRGCWGANPERETRPR